MADPHERLERIERLARLARVRGAFAGATAAPEWPWDAPEPADDHRRAGAEARSRELLASLLLPSELDQWRANATFWVHTSEGWFRFGTLYDIRFRARRWPAVERSICVITEGFDQRPLPDLWAELVVTARARPQALAGTANFRGEAPARAPGAGDPVALRRWLQTQRDAYRRLRTRGAHLDAAYLAFDTAHRTRRSCRPMWARPFASTAAEVVRDVAARHPDERARLDAAHRPIYELVEALRCPPPSGQPAIAAI